MISIQSSGRAFLFAAMLAVGLDSAAAESHSESAAPGEPAGLPMQPSEIETEVLGSEIVTNRIAELPQINKAARFQMALESARKLRESKELKRAENTLIQLLESVAPAEIKRPALLELALVMQEQKAFPKAQQLYSEYVRRYDGDPSVPEVLLRQAYLYREMGIPVLAQSKFYAVISTCLNLKLEEMDYYHRLVLRAQAEIAETDYLQGNYESAIDYFNRLLRLEDLQSERANVLYKLVHSYTKTGQLNEALATARLFLDSFPRHIDAPETRFLLIDTLKKLGRNREAIEELDLLLASQKAESKTDPQHWLYWQQRAGNAVANQFYREGDFLSALQVYQTLAAINSTPEWQLPVWYQIGLVYEKLNQPQKASDMYEKVLSRLKDSDTSTAPNPNLAAVADMAAWRNKNIEWENAARQVTKKFSEAALSKDFLPGGN